MYRCRKNHCIDRPRCTCLVPVWSECYSCCGYRCEACEGTLNQRRPIPSYDERKAERERMKVPSR